MRARVAFLHDHTITSCNFATKNVACETICGVPRDLLYEDLLYANRTSMAFFLNWHSRSLPVLLFLRHAVNMRTVLVLSLGDFDGSGHPRGRKAKTAQNCSMWPVVPTNTTQSKGFFGRNPPKGPVLFNKHHRTQENPENRAGTCMRKWN